MLRKKISKKFAVGIALGILGTGATFAQLFFRGGSEYNTTGVDAQRTSWLKTDRYISKDDFQKGGFQLQWKLKVENQPRQLMSIVGATTSGGGLTKPLNAIVSTNNTITTVDNDTGVAGWVAHYNVPVAGAGTAACPGGMTANASRPVNLNPPAPPAANAAAAGGRAPVGYSSVLGEAGNGLPADAVTRTGFGRAPAAPPAAGAPGAAPATGAPAGGAAAAAGAGAGGFGRGAAAPTYKTPFGGGRFGSGGGFYALASDGMLHTAGDGSGKDLQAPIRFLPANARATDLTAVPENNDQYHSYVIYTSTINSCGGAPNRVWAINLAMDQLEITHVDTGASAVGNLAFGTDGTVYVAVGKGAAGSGYSNAILALEPKTLKVKDWFSDPKADFASTPMVVKSGEKQLVAAATTDGRIYLLDASSLGGSDHKTPAFVSAAVSSTSTDYVPASLASWEDADGSAYIAEPFAGAGPSGVSGGNGKVTNGGIVTLKLSAGGAAPSLTPVWVSGDMTSPLGPMIVNGVMFAASSGEYHGAAGSNASASERASKSVPAVLYALDPATGKQLWSSGKTLTSFVAGTPLWTGSGQTYIATYDNTVYAFGFSEERYSTSGQ